MAGTPHTRPLPPGFGRPAEAPGLHPPGPGRPAEALGSLLTRLRLMRGHSQLSLAEQLCAASGVFTVSRHEISRWERQVRVPGPFWLGWLAAVLDVPVTTLAAAGRPGSRRCAASR